MAELGDDGLAELGEDDVDGEGFGTAVWRKLQPW
jgi:hypothetical protein